MAKEVLFLKAMNDTASLVQEDELYFSKDLPDYKKHPWYNISQIFIVGEVEKLSYDENGVLLDEERSRIPLIAKVKCKSRPTEMDFAALSPDWQAAAKTHSWQYQWDLSEVQPNCFIGSDNVDVREILKNPSDRDKFETQGTFKYVLERDIDESLPIIKQFNNPPKWASWNGMPDVFKVGDDVTFSYGTGVQKKSCKGTVVKVSDEKYNCKGECVEQKVHIDSDGAEKAYIVSGDNFNKIGLKKI